MFAHVVIKLGLEKSVSMLKNTHIPTRMRSYCTKFTSVNDEEWVCHTCLNSLKDNRTPRL